MKAYKLTDEKDKTRNNTQWGEKITHEVTGNSEQLCSSSWIHFYTCPLLAVLMNPIHADFDNPHLWEGETGEEVLVEQLKAGCKRLTTVRKISLPFFLTEQKVAFGILCAKQVFEDQIWNSWANDWLSGKNRNKIDAAWDAAYDAVWNAVRADARAAAADARAAAAADARAAAAADAAAAAAAAAAARTAARDAAWAAEAAAKQCRTINFSDLAKQALTYR